MQPLILITEDEPLNQKLVTAVVEHCGYKPILTTNGKECLQEITRGTCPDLLVVDLQMPVLGGLEVLEQLYSKNVSGCFPILVFSAKNQEEVIRKAVQLGAAEYVIKPFHAEELAQRIKSLVF